MNFKVVEKFVSINGEGNLSGELAVFIRFKGCNLDCSYCDTKWANDKSAEYEVMTSNQIYDFIKETKVKNVTLTGGEPLLQKGIDDLLKLLSSDENLSLEIETNGSVNLKEFKSIKDSIKFTMDYKLPSSNMEDKMDLSNFDYLNRNDVVKFVVGSIEDLDKTKKIIDKYNLTFKTNVYISPVFEKIELNKIVDYMKDNNMNKVKFQIQIHKIIWSKDKRGV
ncbi:putative 7-carboxy-7-deazaguanine synthase QueE [Clostridium oceanicum]|uniref:7-carboxy-7-deazaguanine synthase n=1 Tax=Clostridium oceanicum TaxID=1543 RepID=A0ABN1JUF1_9CLOT